MAKYRTSVDDDPPRISAIVGDVYDNVVKLGALAPPPTMTLNV